MNNKSFIKIPAISLGSLLDGLTTSPMQIAGMLSLMSEAGRNGIEQSQGTT